MDDSTARDDEKRRREATQAADHKVLGGHEIAPRSIPQHFDHSGCVDPKECERYELHERALNDGTAWAKPLPKGRKRRSDKRQRSVMISFRLGPDELESIERAARVRKMTLSTYLRECAMRTAALPHVEITNATGATCTTYTV